MSVVDQAEFHFFHFFPYTDLPSDHATYESLWVDFPNSNYDPQTGHALYTRYLSEMVLADRLAKAGPGGGRIHRVGPVLHPGAQREGDP